MIKKRKVKSDFKKSLKNNLTVQKYSLSETSYIQELPLKTIWDRADKSRISEKDLKLFLLKVTEIFHQPEYISTDPLMWVLKYSDPLDQEIVAFVSAMLAYGNVRQIHKSIELFLKPIENSAFKSPSEWANALNSKRNTTAAKVIPSQWKHRFNSSSDLLVALRWVGMIQQQYGSLGHYFVNDCMQEGDLTIASGLDRWSLSLRRFSESYAVSKGFPFFISSPNLGSACKRYCMFLRWMGRQDRIDPGTWAKINPLRFSAEKLIIPLDTHLQKIAHRFSFTGLKSVNWKMAVEVTNSLKTFDANDPVRYDFALCRLGIMRRI